MKRKTYRAVVFIAILSVIVAVGIAGYSLYQKYKPPETAPDTQIAVIEEGNKREEGTERTEYGTTEQVISGDTVSSTHILPEDSYFEICFFDVGEADSTLVRCDGHMMLVDGGGPGSSSFLYSYLEQNGIEYLDYIVCTHAHEDHVGGLAGALNYAKVGTAFAPMTEYDTRAFNSFVKYLGKQGRTITIPSAGDTFMLGNANVEILAPIDRDVPLAADDLNNASIILRIVYGETAFMITGDAEESEEQSVLDAGVNIKCNVLRVGHHGSYTSTSENFLRAVDPEYCVISVGKDNAYGHPHDEVMNRIAAFGAVVYRTDLNGSIVCTSDGKSVTFRAEK